MDVDTFLSQLFDAETLTKVHAILRNMNENDPNRHVYVHLGNGSNGKSTFLSFLNALFYNTDINETFCTLYEITRYDFDQARRKFRIVHLECTSLRDIPYLTDIPHTIIPYVNNFYRNGSDPAHNIYDVNLPLT